MALEDVRNSPMMKHLMNALEGGESVGHYGRLVFAMVSRHFAADEEVVALLEKDPECDAEQARTLLKQVNARNYNPPHRDRILEWMDRQEFPICQDPDNPRECNVYRDLKFPREIYERIEHFYEHQEPAAV